jgi:hypothetical protein
MHIICSQEQLAPALRTLRNIVKYEVFRLYQSVLFTTVRLPNAAQPNQGILTLTSVSMHGAVGVIKHIPAEVEQEGHILVPIEILTEYISALRPGRLTLRLDEFDQQEVADQALSSQDHCVSCFSASLSEAEPSCTRATSSDTEQPCSPSSSPSMNWSLHRPHVNGTLQIDSTFTSRHGTQSRNQARFPTWSDAHYSTPSISEWMAMSATKAQASQLRQALALCSPFATTSRVLEMAGILLRIEPEGLILISTDGMIVVSHRLSLQSTASQADANLFDAKALSWIRGALPSEGKVTLTLIRNELSTLLISTPELTAFCRAMPNLALPPWGRVLSYPYEEELLLRRNELLRALKCFTSAKIPLSDIRLSIAGKRLLMDLVPSTDGRDTIQSQFFLSLIQPAGGFHVELNPVHLKRLVSKTTGPLLRLQIGTFLFNKEGGHTMMGFLRIPSAQTILMMTTTALQYQTHSTTVSHPHEVTTRP